MERRVYLLSYCVKKKKDQAFFHFNGVYLGNHIKEIIVLEGHEIKKDQVYLLDLNIVSISGVCLETKINRLKEINFLF